MSDDSATYVLSWFSYADPLFLFFCFVESLTDDELLFFVDSRDQLKQFS
jgi:hypothetical protein